MTMTWKIDDASRDLSIVKGKLARVTGAEEVRQRVMIALLHEWQEYFLNIPSGTPWQEIILGSKDAKSVESVLRWVVLAVPGVLSVLVLDSVISTRSLKVYIALEVQGTSGVETVSISLTKGG